MLRITNRVNKPVRINNYISLKPYEVKDLEIQIDGNLRNLERMKLIRITKIDTNNVSVIEEPQKSRKSKKNLEIESE